MTWEDMHNINWHMCKEFMAKGLTFPINGSNYEIGVDLTEVNVTWKG